MKKFLLGFSLIELMISLITISCIAAAFTPLISKKIKTNTNTIGNYTSDCTDKFSSNCALCSKNKCVVCLLSCDDGYFLDNDSCICTSCTQIHSNCSTCSSSVLCTKCKDGYYFDSSTLLCTNLCSDKTPACAVCDSLDGVCTECDEKYYLSSSNECILCSETHGSGCSSCDENECNSCESGYKLSPIDNKCYNDWCSTDTSGLFMRINDICVTKYNMGDKDSLTIPSSVTTVIAGDGTDGRSTECGSSTDYSSSNKCCWQGMTSLSCDSENGGYSGCARTVCGYFAAQAICNNFTYNSKTWRLPTTDELEDFSAYSIGLGADGLKLCNYNQGYSSAWCDYSKRCLGAYGNICNPYDLWAYENPSERDGYYYYLIASDWSGPLLFPKTRGFSVRCVSDI